MNIGVGELISCLMYCMPGTRPEMSSSGPAWEKALQEGWITWWISEKKRSNLARDLQARLEKISELLEEMAAPCSRMPGGAKAAPGEQA